MKILILSDCAKNLYLFKKELLLSLLKDGHEVHVSFEPDGDTDKLRQIKHKNNRLDITEIKINGKFEFIRFYNAYKKLIKEKKPDVVITCTIKPNLYGGFACRIKKVPYLCNVTGLSADVENEGVASSILIKFYKVCMKNAAVVFFYNMKNRDILNKNGIAVNKSRMIPGAGVNLKEHPFVEYPSEEKHIRFLAVIRIKKDKGIGEYLEAAKIMKEKDKSLRFYLVGGYEKEEKNIYEPRIKEFEDKKIIKYFSHTDDVAKIMAKSHIIVHPSYNEGLSNVLLEAAACGRPVLASDISGCIEAFSEGESGFCFESKSTGALVGAMEKILSLSCEQRRQMGIAGRAWVEENFDRNIVLKAYKEELKKIEKCKGDKKK